MAITSAIMQMRRGLEADFDPDKMKPGEWAVSTDKKYVRMCFSPGVCVRMATYEAFENDMEQIKGILSDCQTIQEAVERIQTEIGQTAEVVATNAEMAYTYSNQSASSAKLSQSYAKGGTGTRTGEDTDNAKYYYEKAKETDIGNISKEVNKLKSDLETLSSNVTYKFGVENEVPYIEEL